jgi:glycosyltransferase involved in cell wall biosynthesis
MDREAALLTAVIPVKNLENITSNICKLFSQNLTSVRLIIVLDEVGTFTKELIYDLVKSNKNCDVTILEGKFGNPGGARNAGVALCESDWICFWDADDQPEVSNILKEISLKGSNSDIIVGQYAVLDWMTNAKIRRDQTESNLEAIAMNPGLWRHVFRSEAIEGIVFPDLRMAEDQVFLAHAYNKTLRVKFSESIFYNYYKNVPNQLTSTSKNLEDIEKSLTLLLNLHASPSRFREILLVRQFVTLTTRKISLKKSRFQLYRALNRQIPGKILIQILVSICAMKSRAR